MTMVSEEKAQSGANPSTDSAVELAVAVSRLQREANVSGLNEEAFLLSLVVQALEERLYSA